MHRLFRSLILLAATIGGSSCVTPAASGPLVGSWGGPHVGLTLTQDGGTVEYDCAAGRIAGPVVPLADGSFRASGTHTPAIGGPERVGEVRPSYPASYSGRVRGREMTLLVALRAASGTERIGPFALKRDAAPQLLRCL